MVDLDKLLLAIQVGKSFPWDCLQSGNNLLLRNISYMDL